MRWVSLANFTSGAVCGLAAAYLGMPLWKSGVMQLHQDRFGELTFLCDNAMRAHFLATQELASDPSQPRVDAVQSAEIGLIDCQDYDMYRKMLIRWGLTENELSEMSLLAVEARASELREVVRFHEIRY